MSAMRRFTLRALTTLLGLTTFVGIALGAFAGSAQAATSPHNGVAASSTVYPSGENDVVIGAYIVNIQAIDFETSSYTADLFVWMRWSNRDLHPDEHFEVMNSSDSWDTTIAPLEVGPLEQSDGTLYHSFHYQGGFNFKPNLQDFPFGEQNLPIIVEGTTNGEFGINFIPDSTPVVVDPGLTLPGFKIGETTLTTSAYTYGTDFGEVGVNDAQGYSRTVINVPISNPVLANIVKYFLPLFLIVITASLVFLIPSALGEARIALGITALLTMVAMEGSKANGLPAVEYLMLIDVLYILSYFFIVVTIFHSIALTWAHRKLPEGIEVKNTMRYTWIYLVAYFAIAALTILLFVLI